MTSPPLKEMYDRLFRAFGPQGWWPGDTPFEVAIGAILTQNTNWSNVEKAIAALKAEKALSAGAINEMPEESLAALIRPAGYFNVKARRLKHFCGFLARGHRGSMKTLGRGRTGELRRMLLAVNGIGPETADSILLYALGKPVFVIDAYTVRVLTRHSIVPSEGSYEDFRSLFESALGGNGASDEEVARLYNEYHALFVELGKRHCKARAPLCCGCPVEGMDINGFGES